MEGQNHREFCLFPFTSRKDGARHLFIYNFYVSRTIYAVCRFYVFLKVTWCQNCRSGLPGQRSWRILKVRPQFSKCFIVTYRVYPTVCAVFRFYFFLKSLDLKTAARSRATSNIEMESENPTQFSECFSVTFRPSRTVYALLRFYLFFKVTWSQNKMVRACY